MAYKAFDLTGKAALITGGNSGIGLGMAEALAQAGAAVCIWGTNAAKNAAALKKIQSHGAKAIALHCDVGDEQQVEQRFAETVAALGPLQACFANAGVSGRSNVTSFAEMSTEEWKRVTRVNLDGAFYTLRAAAKHMAGHGKGGALVGTASLAAISGTPRGEH
jgi:NAD(P)-dependent dehydrogenase (short-subunit alcohol dehydrogenase family)